MSERLGFALVLIVAIASIASLLFMSGTQSTASVVYGQPNRGIAIDNCVDVMCPGHAPAEALIDAHGRVVYKDDGKAICICPFR
jgi:hypothetical protein